MDSLSTELLAKILAVAASEHRDCHGNPDTPCILSYTVGPLILVCKRFTDAIHTAGFWRECTIVTNSASLYDPRHAQWIRQLAVELPGAKSDPEDPCWEVQPVPGVDGCTFGHLDAWPRGRLSTLAARNVRGQSDKHCLS